MSISFITPTSGRHSICFTLSSIIPYLKPQDEILIRCDDSNDWGHTPRNKLMYQATGDWLMFIDDDDVYLSMALDKVRAILAIAPKVPHIFKMYHGENVIWGDKDLRQGNVGTPCFVIPRGPFGHWSSEYHGDFDFIKSTVDLYDGQMVWVDEIIAKWRIDER